MGNAARSLILLTALFCARQAVSAPADAQPTPPSGVTLNLSPNPPAIRLSARATPLPQILARLARQTGVPIHYAQLPAEPVTAHCLGADVKLIVACLFGRPVNIAARIRGPVTAANPQIAELWLLPELVPASPAATSQLANVAAAPQEPPKKLTFAEKRQAQQHEWLRAAHAQDPEQRATAIYNLGLSGRDNNPRINKTLRAALADPDANVRAQAAVSLAQRGENVAARQASQTAAMPADDEQSPRLSPQDLALLQKASKSGDPQAVAWFRNRLPADAKAEQ